MGAEIRLEIARAIVKAHGDPLAQVGDEARLEDVDQCVSIAGAGLLPIDRQLAQMRHRRERVDGRMTRRCHVGIARAWMMHIE